MRPPVAREKRRWWPYFNWRLTVFKRIAAALADDNIVSIFPEGKITFDGKVNPFKPGVETILANSPVPVIPMALDSLWGSFFSRKKGAAMKGLPKPSRRRIKLTIGQPCPPTTKAIELEEKVMTLLTQQEFASGRLKEII